MRNTHTNICGRVAFAILAMVLISGCAAKADAQYYGKTIVASPKVNTDVGKSLADLSSTLKEVTGQTFQQTETAAAKGIVVAYADQKNIPAEMAKQLHGNKNLEAFVINSDDENRLWIVANFPEGLRDGIYYYLAKLGCRWYYPNKRWTIIPHRDDITLKINELQQPDFLTRNFFGTGGFGPLNPVDPKLEMRGRWGDWKRRNIFAQQLPEYGHVGHAFNIRHKKELEAHPEWRALINGKRAPYSSGVKLDYSNPDALALLTEDRLEALGELIKKYGPDSIKSLYIGVGPPDGGGFATGPQPVKIGSGSTSDSVFHMVNVVARAVAKKYPGHGVSLYAYAQFAAVPTIKLEPNIHLTIIPYAFQRTGLTGDQLLEAWDKKIKQDGLDKFSPTGLYTYWSITDWSKDLPGFDFRNTPKERIPYWYHHSIASLKFESTYSPGATGPGLYLASHLMWNVHADSDALLDEFYDQSFGKARAPMQQMLERWTDHFLLTDQELALSYQDLSKAEQLAAGDKAVQGRIGDYIRYVQYLRRWHEWKVADKTTKTQKARDLVKLMWQIYPSGMIQPYRMWRLMGYRFATNAGLKDYFNPKQKDAPEWKTLPPVTDKVLDEWLAQGVKDYQSLGFQPRKFTGKLVPLDPTVRPQEGLIPKEGSRTFSSYRTTTFYAMALPGVTTLPLQISLRDWGKAPRHDKVTVLGPDGKKVFFKEILKGTSASFDVPMKKPGLYTITVQDQVIGFHLRAGAGIPFGTDNFNPWGISPRLYFYVPKGLKKLALYNSPLDAKPNTLYDPTGKAIDLRKNTKPLVVVDVPPGMDGKVWSIQRNSATSPVRLLNAPTFFAFSPETLLVPEDALK